MKYYGQSRFANRKIYLDPDLGVIHRQMLEFKTLECLLELKLDVSKLPNPIKYFIKQKIGNLTHSSSFEFIWINFRY